MDPLVGKTLSHYRVLEPLGSGGMGIVYRARDENLQRDVALKVLPPDVLENDAAHRRFRKEALALSKLNHPHICTIHDFGSQEGVDFLVMEYVEGETLTRRLERGALPEADVVRLGRQVADALAAAHEQGVIHRDLKPGNIMLTARGDAKVVDFGLAKERRVAPTGGTTATTATVSAEVIGTLPYMAPEQLMGGTVDARTDVYALGVTLYQLATGKLPHESGSSVGLADAILHREPTPPRSRSRSISRGLDAVILRCLEKNPARRYASAGEVRDALVHPGSPLAWADVARRRLRKHGRRVLAAAAVLGAVLALTIRISGGPGRSGPGGCAADVVRTIAVLPLANLSGDKAQEFFADGMTEQLITCLGQLHALRVTSRTSVMGYKADRPPIREIAKKLGVGLLIEGSILRAGNVVRISTTLIDGAADRLIWSGNFDRDVSDILSLQTDVARLVAEQVQVRVAPGEIAPAGAKRAIDPAAYEDYLRGVEQVNQWSNEAWQNADDLFRKAIARAPNFAPAHVGLGTSYLYRSSIFLPAAEAMPRARAAAQRALEIDSTLASAHAVRAYVLGFYDYDWSAAESEFRRALDLNPSDALASEWYGYMLLVNGRFQEAKTHYRRARELDPLSEITAGMSLMPLYEGRTYDEAIQAGTTLLEAEPNAALIRFIRGQAYLKTGRAALAIEDFRKAIALGHQPVFTVFLARAALAVGDSATARRARDEVLHPGEGVYVQPYILALLHLTFGEREAALRELERGVDEKTEEVTWLKVDPAMDSLRSEPRYRALLKRLRLAS